MITNRGRPALTALPCGSDQLFYATVYGVIDVRAGPPDKIMRWMRGLSPLVWPCPYPNHSVCFPEGIPRVM